jgi:hypothetical protein
MKPLLEILVRILAAFAPARFAAIPATTVWPTAPAREELLWANTGGPRSRVVSTPLVSRALSEGSASLGCQPLAHYQMRPRFSGDGFREWARRLLREAGFTTPEQAWHALREKLPAEPALVADIPPAPETAPSPDEENHALLAALVLGKCCGSLFSPTRPIIWSERRLARSIRLVHCDSATYTREDEI